MMEFNVTKNKQSATADIWLLIITSANLDRFSKFFHCQITYANLVSTIMKSFHLTLNVLLTTLPC